MENRELKLKAASRGIKLWKITDERGMSDSSFCRKLRHEFTEEERERVFGITENLTQESDLK